MDKDNPGVVIPRPAPDAGIGAGDFQPAGHRIPTPPSAADDSVLFLTKRGPPRDGESFSLEAVSVSMGKPDPVLGNAPEIDLGALETGRGFVSRVHAEIIRTADGWAVRDLGSTNGTYLNDRRLAKGDLLPIQEGDRLRFGLVEFITERRREP